MSVLSNAFFRSIFFGLLFFRLQVFFAVLLTASTVAGAPSLTVTGINAGDFCAGETLVGATVEDPSGVDRVEFSIQRYDGIHSDGTWALRLRHVDQQKQNAAGDQLTSSPALSVGSNPAYVAHGAFSYTIGGTTYNKSPNLVGISPGSDVPVYLKWATVAFDIGTDGIVHAISAPQNTTTGYSSMEDAIADLPNPADEHARMGTVSVFRAKAFTFGTTSLRDTNPTNSITLDSALTWHLPSYPYPNGSYSVRTHAYSKDSSSTFEDVNIVVDNPVIGKGCTNGYVIDDDCDGYGVGSQLGPDGDDTDVQINVSETVTAAYPDIPAFLAAKGLTGILRYVVIDAENGNDSNGEISSSYETAASTAYRTWNGCRASLMPGDCVIFRQGTYPERFMNAYPAKSGTVSNPIYLIAYPGETATLSGGGMQLSSGSSGIGSNLVVDGMGGGLVVTGSASRQGDGITFGGGKNITVRELEICNIGRGSHSSSSMSNIVFERNVVHHTAVEHLIYWGARDHPPSGRTPNSDLFFRENILYASVANGFQHNGKVSNMILEKNIIHSISATQILLMQGGQDITIQNNVMFGGLYPIAIWFYGGYCMGTGTSAMPSGGLNVFDMTDLLIVNNTFHKARFQLSGNPEHRNEHTMIRWRCGADFTAPAWLPNHAYDQQDGSTCAVDRARNQWAAPTSGVENCTYAVMTAGTSGNIEPDWSGATYSGATVTDGTVTWVAFCKPSISNHVVRNNIIYTEGTRANEAIFMIGNDDFLQAITIENNLLFNQYRNDPQASAMLLPDSSKLSFADFESYSANWRNNSWADPLLVASEPTWAPYPWLYDLITHGDSPAKGLGTSAGMPAADIRGAIRGGYDAGAYNLSSGIVPGDINGDSIVNLDDTITALQVATGATPLSVNIDADVNGDGMIGVEDAITTLQIIATQP